MRVIYSPLLLIWNACIAARNKSRWLRQLIIIIIIAAVRIFQHCPAAAYTSEHHYIQSGWWLSPTLCNNIQVCIYKVKSWWIASVFNEIFIKVVTSRDARQIPVWPNVKHMWLRIILFHYYSWFRLYLCILLEKATVSIFSAR